MAGRMSTLVDGGVYLLVRVAIAVVQACSLETCQAVSRWVAFLAARVIRLRGAVLDENLRTVYPASSPAERLALAEEMWQHLLLMVCEIAHAPRKLHRRNWHQYITIPQKRRLVRELLDDRPLVMVSGHFGNFEMGGYVAGMLGFPSYTVARTLDNPYLDRFVNRFRGTNGQFILAKTGSSGDVSRVLESGGLLVALGDQSAGPKGCWIDFFGKPASYHKAIALFPLLNEARLAVVNSRRVGGPLHFEIGLLGVLDPRQLDAELRSVPAVTQWYNDLLEAMVRQSPEQYWWVHRRWKGAPRTGVSASAKAA